MLKRVCLLVVTLALPVISADAQRRGGAAIGGGGPVGLGGRHRNDGTCVQPQHRPVPGTKTLLPLWYAPGLAWPSWGYVSPSGYGAAESDRPPAAEPAPETLPADFKSLPPVINETRPPDYIELRPYHEGGPQPGVVDIPQTGWRGAAVTGASDKQEETAPIMKAGKNDPRGICRRLQRDKAPIKKQAAIAPDFAQSGHKSVPNKKGRPVDLP